MIANVKSACTALLIAAVLQGCTIVGLSIGSAVPKYRGRPPEPESLAECEKPEIVLREASAGRRGMIAPLSAHNDEIVRVQADDGERTRAWKDVRAVRCRTGSYAGVGALIGGITDVIVLSVYFLGENPIGSVQ